MWATMKMGVVSLYRFAGGAAKHIARKLIKSFDVKPLKGRLKGKGFSL